MKTYMAKESTIERKWYLVDAKGKTLGRLASEIAKILMGKNKPEYTPHCDTGDFVVVINADKVYLSGKKLDQKIYRKHSGHPGGMKEVKYGELIEEKPEFAFRLAVKRMLPKTSLGRKMAKKLYVYAGSEQPHAAQKPEKVELV